MLLNYSILCYYNYYYWDLRIIDGEKMWNRRTEITMIIFRLIEITIIIILKFVQLTYGNELRIQLLFDNNILLISNEDKIVMFIIIVHYRIENTIKIILLLLYRKYYYQYYHARNKAITLLSQSECPVCCWFDCLNVTFDGDF